MSEHSADSRRGISTRTVEIVVAVCILALGALVVFDSRRLGAAWGSDGPQAGYFPFYIGAIVCICALIVLAYAVVGKTADSKVFVTWRQLRLVLQVLGPAALYVLGIQLFGIYLSSVIYIAVFMLWLGRYSFMLSAGVGVSVMVAFYLMFEMWFKVPLYKGLYDLLSFLGH
jgi:hypothetical protein